MTSPEMDENVPVFQPQEPAFEKVRISKEVISQIATQALLKVIGVRAAKGDNGRMSFSQGVSITVEEGRAPSIIVDTFVETKYGLRIPDIAWYIQESVKTTLEQNTGYRVKAVNVYVQSVYIEEVNRPGQILMNTKAPAQPPVKSPEPVVETVMEEPVQVEEQDIHPEDVETVETDPKQEESDEEKKSPKKSKTSIFGKGKTF